MNGNMRIAATAEHSIAAVQNVTLAEFEQAMRYWRRWALRSGWDLLEAAPLRALEQRYRQLVSTHCGAIPLARLTAVERRALGLWRQTLHDDDNDNDNDDEALAPHVKRTALCPSPPPSTAAAIASAPPAAVERLPDLTARMTAMMSNDRCAWTAARLAAALSVSPQSIHQVVTRLLARDQVHVVGLECVPQRQGMHGRLLVYGPRPAGSEAPDKRTPYEWHPVIPVLRDAMDAMIRQHRA